MPIQCVAVVDKENHLLFFKTFSAAGAPPADELRLQYIVYSSLDFFEIKDVKKTDYFVGLLMPIEEFRVYGYSTNTKTQIIVVADETETKDADFKTLCRKLHSLYVDAVCNPFYVLGEPITSPKFAVDVQTAVSAAFSQA